LSCKHLVAKCDFGFGSGLDIGLAGDRSSLIPIFTSNIKLSYGPATIHVVAPPSSGEESEEEIIEAI
jgi:hypothetical protein